MNTSGRFGAAHVAPESSARSAAANTTAAFHSGRVDLPRQAGCNVGSSVPRRARDGVAHHEAAHAIVGGALGRRPYFMTTRREGSLAGVVKFEPRTDAAGRFGDACIAFAGGIAERLLTDTHPTLIVETCLDDARQAADGVRSIAAESGADFQTLLTGAARLAEGLVRRHAEQIRDLAAFVERKGGAIGPEQLEGVLAYLLKESSVAPIDTSEPKCVGVTYGPSTEERGEFCEPCTYIRQSREDPSLPCEHRFPETVTLVQNGKTLVYRCPTP